jgi:ABC-type transport system involved in multi-copper enzyme maturation permease subunit
MFRNIYLKSLYNLRWQLLGWTLGIGFVTFLTVIFYSSLAIGGFGSITKSVPPSLQALVGSLEDFASIGGYVGQFVFGSKTTTLLVPMAIILFITQSVSEESDGRLATLLTLPVSRAAAFIQKWLAAATVLIVVCLGMVAVTLMSVTLQHGTIDTLRLAESAGTCLLMCLAFGSAAYGLGMLIGYKGLTIAAVSVYAGLSLIISSLAPNIAGLKVIDHLSLLHYYNVPNIMLHGINVTHTLILVTATAACLIVGWLGFRRRSLQLS